MQFPAETPLIDPYIRHPDMRCPRPETIALQVFLILRLHFAHDSGR
jgi:hypothetical protein